MHIQNLFTSGHAFSEDEYELRFKYILFNTLILFNVTVAGIASVIRLFNMQYLQSIADIIYVLCAFSAFLIARYSKNALNALMYFVIFFSYAVVTFLFYNGLNPLAGTAWYILVLMISFVFKGRRTGLFVFILSLLSIIAISSVHYHYSASEIFLGLLPYTAVIFFLYIFDKQNENLKNTIDKQKQRYKHLSRHDTLTGVPNRAFFFHRLNRLCNHYNNTRKKAALLFLDLDNFKMINDTYGHQVGDTILQEVARRIQKQLTHHDLLARYGGDEFALIIDREHTDQTLRSEVEKILRAIEAPLHIDGNEHRITLSIGATIYPDDGTEELSLLSNADAAMYHAKKKREEKYCFYAEIAEQNA